MLRRNLGFMVKGFRGEKRFLRIESKSFSFLFSFRNFFFSFVWGYFSILFKVELFFGYFIGRLKLDEILF